jgi:hypothetical protein
MFGLMEFILDHFQIDLLLQGLDIHLHTLIVLAELLIEESTSLGLVELIAYFETLFRGVVVLLHYLLDYLEHLVLLQLTAETQMLLHEVDVTLCFQRVRGTQTVVSDCVLYHFVLHFQKCFQIR